MKTSHLKCIIVILLLFIVYILINDKRTVVTDVKVEPTDDLFKTVSHITLEEGLPFEKVYDSDDSDVAYYRYTGEKELVKKGDTVISSQDVSYTVTDTDIEGFYFLQDGSIVPGTSGTSVFNEKGEIVGYVSAVLQGKIVKCIWN